MPCETADVFPASPRQCALQCRVVKKSRPTRFSSILGGGIRSPAGRSQTSWHTEDLAQPIQLFACRSRLLPDIAAELPFSSLAYTVEKATHLFGGATMTFVLQPWQLCLVILASWINREQQAREASSSRAVGEILGFGWQMHSDRRSRSDRGIRSSVIIARIHQPWRLSRYLGTPNLTSDYITTKVDI